MIDRHDDRHPGVARVRGRARRLGAEPGHDRTEAEADPAEGDREQDQEHVLQRLQLPVQHQEHLPEPKRGDQRAAAECDHAGQHDLAHRALRGGAGRGRAAEILDRHRKRHLGRGGRAVGVDRQGRRPQSARGFHAHHRLDRAARARVRPPRARLHMRKRRGRRTCEIVACGSLALHRHSPTQRYIHVSDRGPFSACRRA